MIYIFSAQPIRGSAPGVQCLTAPIGPWWWVREGSMWGSIYTSPPPSRV